MKKRPFVGLHTGLLILLVLSLGLNSCKKGGGGITDSDDPEVPTPIEITSSFESEETSFLPGEIQLIIVEEAVLEDNEYKAELANGAAVTLYLNSEDTDNKSLIFVVPEEGSGNHELIFELEEQEQSLEFEIGEYDEIKDPKELVAGFTDQISIELETIIEQTQEPEVANLLQTKKNELAEHYEEFQSLSGEQQKVVARIIHTNFGLGESNQKSKSYQLQGNLSCTDAKKTLKAQTRKVVLSLGGLAIGQALISAGPFGIIISGISAAGLIVTLNPLIDSIGEFIEICFTKDEILLSSLSSSKEITRYKKLDAVTFTHDEIEALVIEAVYDLDEEFYEILAELQSSLTSFFTFLPDKWVDIIEKEDYEQTKTEDADIYSLATISDSEIEGNISAADSVLSLTFSFKEDSNPTEALDFSFSLTDAEDHSFEVEATLNPPLPIAYDMQFSTEINGTLNDTLKADYAASFSIESPPSNGTLTLVNENLGVFEYEPDEDFSGDDSFSFSATNSTGNSEVGIVSVGITDDDLTLIPQELQGTWERTWDDGVIDVLKIEESHIENVFKDNYKECWEDGRDLEINKDFPRERNGDTYAYTYTESWSDDSEQHHDHYEIILSIEGDDLKVEASFEGDNFVMYFSKSTKDINNLHYCGG